jgi:hypothetical protein
MPFAARCLMAFAGLFLLAPDTTAQSRDVCADLLTHTTTHIVNDSYGRRTIRLENRRCRLEVGIRGGVRYTADFRSIAALPDGGSFIIEEDAEGATRRLELTDDGRDGVAVDYRIGREARPFDAEAQSWLADRLLLLYRRTGLAAAERAEWLHRTGGIEALLREAELMQSSSARTATLVYAVQQPGLRDADVVRLLGSSLPSSSSGRSNILRSIAERRTLDGELGAAWLDAVAATSSSSHKRELLTQVLRSGRAPARMVPRVLRTAAGVSSSSAKAEVLRAAVDSYRFDQPMLDAYLVAAASISSSSGQRTAFGAVATQQELTTPQLTRVLRALRSVSSATVRADVLIQLAGSRRLEGEARSAYVDVANSISSSSRRARVLAALERGPGDS